MATPILVYHFNAYSVSAQWRVVDDIVMGGRSEGHFAVTPAKNGRFYGDVSLENNGGFSSVRHAFDPPVIASGHSGVSIHLRGDGSRFEFSIKAEAHDRHVYATHFETSGQWEKISLQFADLYPLYRGDRLEGPSYGGGLITEIGFLIGNDRPQAFELLLDRLDLV